MSWFDVDRKGLAAVLERRGKAFVLAELVSNAWDSGATGVSVRLTPIEGVPQSRLVVVDDGTGFADLKHAYTMFARSDRAGDPIKRGRFNLGEKLVLAVCREVDIQSTSGLLCFKLDQRTFYNQPTNKGTIVDARLAMTRDELHEVNQFMLRLIPPVPTSFNGNQLTVSEPLAKFEAKLPTEYRPDDSELGLRRTIRIGEVHVHEPMGEGGEILELGIPVVECDLPYRINVLQKVPLNMERDNVTPAFLKTLSVAVLNHMHERLNAEELTQPWAQEAAGDARALPATVKDVVTKRFGERVVIGTPGDPIANAKAQAAGFTVLSGGAMSGDMWNNVKKHELLVASSAAFPTPKGEELAKMQTGVCPVCGK